MFSRCFQELLYEESFVIGQWRRLKYSPIKTPPKYNKGTTKARTHDIAKSYWPCIHERIFITCSLASFVIRKIGSVTICVFLVKQHHHYKGG